MAVKILSDTWAGDPERLARFEREARTLAALNHPHIAQLHGFEPTPAAGASGATQYALVMELVEGEDLAERLSRTVPQYADRPFHRVLVCRVVGVTGWAAGEDA